MTDKIKIEDMKCYQEVVDVIGVTRAKIELWKVVKEWDAVEQEERGYNLGTLVNKILINAFDWDSTKLGHDFWGSIYDKGTHYEG